MTSLQEAGDHHARVTTAARRSLASPGADVHVQASSPYSDEATALDGVIDIGQDRCRLDGPSGDLVFDGPETYERLEDGRWRHHVGTPGTHGLLHPRWMLDAIAATSWAEPAEQGAYAFGIDHPTIDRLVDVGVDPDWWISALVTIDDNERVSWTQVTLQQGPDPGASMWLALTLSYRSDAPAIELPTHTVESEDYLREVGHPRES